MKHFPSGYALTVTLVNLQLCVKYLRDNPLLVSGVPLGVHTDLPASPAWPTNDSTRPDPTETVVHYDEWSGAPERPEIVTALLKEEEDHGFIAKVPGGVDEQHSQVAVGKLNVILSPDRSPPACGGLYREQSHREHSHPQPHDASTDS